MADDEVGFLAIYASEVEWQDDTDLLHLPEGVQVKVLMHDPARDLRVMLVKFPPGYHEPAHVHAGTHADTIIQGTQVVGGKSLRQGDLCYGPAGVEHGPFDYPEGCVVFAVFQGDTVHKY